MQECGGIKDFQADDLPVLPVEYDHCSHSFGWVDRNAVTAWRQRFVSQVDVRGISLRVVSQTHDGDGIADLDRTLTLRVVSRRADADRDRADRAFAAMLQMKKIDIAELYRAADQA